MRVYVDQAIHRWRGQLWCHLFSPDLDQLHAFAAAIGMRREWFQDPNTMPKVSWPHYDINQKRRPLALAHGAIELGRHQTVAMSRVIINRYLGLSGTQDEIDPLEGHRRRGSPMIPRLETWLAKEMRKFEERTELRAAA